MRFPRLPGYLCPLNANAFGVEFLKFEIKDYETGRPVYQVRSVLGRSIACPLLQLLFYRHVACLRSYLQSPSEALPEELTDPGEEALRSVRYSFPADFLTYKTIRTA